MSSLFLVDLFSDQIVEKRALSPTQSVDVTGRYGIFVPDGIDVGVPPDVPTLIQRKYAGITAALGFFTGISYDDLQTTLKVNVAASSGVVVAARVGVSIRPPMVPNLSALVTTNQPLSGTPTQAFLVYDAFFYEDTDTKTGRFHRSITLPAAGDPDASLDVSLSFNGGFSANSVVPNQVIDIAVADQGNSLRAIFTKFSGTKRLVIGSWAVLYQ